MNSTTSKNELHYSLTGFTLQFEQDFEITSDSCKRKIRKVFNALVDCGFAPIETPSYPEYSSQKGLLEVLIESRKTCLTEVCVIQKAWEFIYIIYQHIPDVIYVEPRIDFVTQTDGLGMCCWWWGCFPCSDAQSNERRQDVRIKLNPEWHLEEMQVISAWKKYFMGNLNLNDAGRDIIIGHPDSGYLPHPEVPYSKIEISNLHIPARQEISEGQHLDQSLAGNPEAASPSVWHGTATASIMVSPRGSTDDSRNKPFVSGVAPGATLLPIQLGSADYDFRLYSVSLAKAINYAASDDPKRFGKPRVDVLSISLNGYPTWSVRRAIVNANKKGIIVIASAGNGIPFVAWPAAYDNVIAVASSTIDGKRANHSAFGSRVNIAAPGQDIYCAILLKNGEYAVEPRSGTSYAAPLVAGVAALWLSHHRQELNEKYVDDPAKIPLAFAKLLNQTCTPWEWGEENCGPGIVNADKLLEAPLPDANDPDLLIPRVIQYNEHLPLDRGGVITFNHLFEGVLSHQKVIRQISSRKLNDPDFLKEVGTLGIMEWSLEKLIGRSNRSLRSFLNLFGHELSFHFSTNPDLYDSFVDALHAEKIEEFLLMVRQKLCDVASKNLREELLKSSQKS
jgi:serine protease